MNAARLVRFWLACELGLYVLLGVGLVQLLGWTPAQAALAMLVLAAAGRALFVAATLAFGWAYASPPPAQLRIGAARTIAMALREYVAFVVLFSMVIPFERFFLGEDRLSRLAPGRLPLLLIHGYQCNRGVWLWIRRALERAGWCVATLNLEPVFNDIDGYAEQVERRIDEVCSATGTSQVILVGHSMGGLVARAYLRAFGRTRVAKLITLGSPHHGSRLAHYGLGENARQMCPESAWLARINAPGAGPLPDATVSIYSCHDNYVVPQDSSRLDGAKIVPVAGVGHLAMAFAPEIESLLLAELTLPSKE
jgi:triacylglycerol lipase